MRTLDQMIDGVREMHDEADRRWDRLNRKLQTAKEEARTIERQMEDLETLMSLYLDLEKELVTMKNAAPRGKE